MCWIKMLSQTHQFFKIIFLEYVLLLLHFILAQISNIVTTQLLIEEQKLININTCVEVINICVSSSYNNPAISGLVDSSTLCIDTSSL